MTLYTDVKDKREWNAANIEARAKRLANIILNLFKISGPDVEISFADPRYKEYSCDNPSDATNKWPNYYVLQGERVNVQNFQHMLRSVVDKLFKVDSTIIKGLALNEKNPIDGYQSIVFTYKSRNVNSDYRIGDTGIYVRLGYSAAHTISIIKALLQKYDIDTDDFVYSAREYKKASVDD